MGGSSSPSKPKMSSSEKAQHAVAAAEWGHYKQNYAPLENRYLSDSQKDYSARGGAQARSQVMREGTEAMQLSALRGGVSDVASTVANASTASGVESAGSSQALRDERMVGALGVGRGVAANTTNSMSSLAQTGAQGAIGDMRNKLTVNMARDRALPSLAMNSARMAAGMPSDGGDAPEYSSNIGTLRNATTRQQQNSWAPPPSIRRH